ncbi:MAG: hypothetical protein IPP82_04415 [Xanthomonadales bacterium]|nr:hypothetical protein [Xanthomonadales bacterium]
MSKHSVGSLRAALSIALLAGAGSAFAVDNVATLVGGDLISGDQATVALDGAVANAFSYSNSGSGGVATVYLNAHVFCAEAPRVPSQIAVQPRYQLPAAVGNDVWKFPDVYAHSLSYQGGGAQNAGAPTLLIGQADKALSKQFRCLSAQPGDSLDRPNVSHGLFDSGFGGTVTPTPPSGPSQNVTVNAQTFGGFAGQAVSVVKIDTQFDPTAPTGVVWTLVDGFNTSALSALAGATWCGLGTLWVEGTSPPPQLCDDAILAGVIKESGQFVRHQFSALPGFTAYYVLVYRPVVGSATAGTPRQGFAALRTGGGMVGVAEESQDWFTDDSVWYTY